jgi:alpha-L-fucosidase 2
MIRSDEEYFKFWDICPTLSSAKGRSYERLAAVIYHYMPNRLRSQRTLLAAICAIALCRVLKAQDASDQNHFIAENDVTWTSPGKDENDSMPIGNGDLAANVWTEQSGDLVLLLSKADAWTEMGKLVKLGRVRIHLDQNPFAGGAAFTQVLRLENASIEIKSGNSTMRIWIDANHPAMHVEMHLERPSVVQAKLELWRTTHPLKGHSPDKGGMFELASDDMPVDFCADTVCPALPDRISWCHFNTSSVYPVSLQQQHLESLASKYPDPLLHRCFGATLTGTSLVSADDRTLKSANARQDFRVDLIALNQTPAESVKAWQAALDAIGGESNPADLQAAWEAHQKWWQDFWNRSWIHVAGTEDAARVSQGYAMQRFMMAASSRGELPTKFNGGLFTVGRDVPEHEDATDADHNPDYRKWGNSYWNQNNRLLYWPLVTTGDDDLLKPWFAMYLRALPLAIDRAQLYYHHGGASLPETMSFWGLPCLHDFGWNNPTNEITSPWQKYHIQGTLEVIAQMLDYYDATQDAEFARKSLVPFADAVVTFYDQHWPRDAGGKIRMAPAQSLETYRVGVLNPTPDIAGLMADIPRLLALPAEFTSDAQRAAWAKTLRDLPPIPMGRTAHGKLPPMGQGDADGMPVILPAEKYGATGNSENPELYVAFPYRLYGVGKPDLALARDTFKSRRFAADTCWGQDGTESAVLGLTAVAKKAAIAEFTDYGSQRFGWFWKAANDWIPDLDNGGSGMITLQLMLMQCDGKRIQLLPAWPNDWTADFRLHAPYQTIVQGHVENGKITDLKITPEARAKDVVLVHQQQAR